MAVDTLTAVALLIGIPCAIGLAVYYGVGWLHKRVGPGYSPTSKQQRDTERVMERMKQGMR